MDMPAPSIGSSQYELAKPGAFGTTFSLRPASASPATSGVLDADHDYYRMHGPVCSGAKAGQRE